MRSRHLPAWTDTNPRRRTLHPCAAHRGVFFGVPTTGKPIQVQSALALVERRVAPALLSCRRRARDHGRLVVTGEAQP